MPRPALCHPERPHYAKGLCQSCYRKQRTGTNFDAEKYGYRLPAYKANYEAKTKAQKRRQRYYRVRKAIGQVLGVSMPQLTKVFDDCTQLAQLRSARKDGHEALLSVWHELSIEQQQALQ